MSFARAKITRFNEKPNTRTDSGSGLKTTTSNLKSQIPKINRSHSQPHNQPSKDSARSKNSDQQRKGTELLLSGCNLTLDNVNSEKTGVGSTLVDNSVKSEDFKDALDERHDNSSSLDPLRDVTQLPVDIKDSLGSRKSSASGIPLPVKNSASKVSSKASPRIRSGSRESDSKSITSPTKRSLELQFLAKKKKLEQLKHDLEVKQKPVVELYQSLLQIKKKLEESGKIVPLENIKILNCDDHDKSSAITILEHTNVCGGGEELQSENKVINLGYMDNLRDEMEPIPRTFHELGKCLMSKRGELIQIVQKLKEDSADRDQVGKDLTYINDETDSLQKTITEAVERQEQRIGRILKEVGGIFEKSSLAIANQMIVDLEKKLKQQEKVLMEVNEELITTQQQLKEMKEVTTNKLSEENNTMKERIKTIECDLQAKKKKLAEQYTSSRSNEQKIDMLNKQVLDLEKAKKEAETKVNELNSHMRTLQNKLKNVEQKWRDEKEEIMKSHKGEHAILEKLTAERQQLDTRVHVMNNILDEQKKKHEVEQARLRMETVNAKEELSSMKIDKQILEDKLESLHDEVARLSVQQQQAVDVIKNTINSEKNTESVSMSEKEAQLRTELLATRVALKAAQDRIENYASEKMRFIASIEKLNGDGDTTRESLGKALVQKEEMITKMENEKLETAKTVENQNMLISQLNAKIDNLQAGVVVSNLDNIPQDTQELKVMLEEGKAKLQKALAKSLENEQKLIKYEHDLNQQKKQLNDMDNLLKVRDGLIGMLKAKKDELLMENDSLHRYSEEIRQLLFDTKEEVKLKAETIQEMTGTIENRERTCYKLEKRIKELESNLSETNEKRFKLQDTVGSMEKELQTTKAHINQIAEMQTRYEIGMPPLNTDVNTNHKGNQNYYKFYTENSSNFARFGNDSYYDSSKYHPQSRQMSALASYNQYGDGNTQNRAAMSEVYRSAELNNDVTHSEISHSYNSAPTPTNTGRVKYSQYTSAKSPYYVKIQPYSLHTNYGRNMAQLPPNHAYRQYHTPYYRPLTQSMLHLESPYKIHSIKNNSSPGLIQPRKSVKIQTCPQNATSFTQTDALNNVNVVNNIYENKNLQFLVYPTGSSKYSSEEALQTISEVEGSEESYLTHDPYKICCDMLAKEENSSEEVENLPESKIKERREFINVVKKLSEFDRRSQRKDLGLGKEFTPILFGGISRYKVLESGSLVWCKPSREMRLNNLLITKDIIAHSNHHMSENLDKTLKTLENNFIKPNCRD